MRIALLTYNIGHGGKTNHIIDLAKGFVEKGHEVYIITTGTYGKVDSIENEKLSAFQKLGAHLIEINVGKSSQFFNIRKLRNISFGIRLKLILIFKKIDIVHSHDTSFATLLSKMKVPFINTQHMNFDIETGRVVKAYHEIAISSQLLQETKKKLNYKEDEISLVFNGVNIKFSNLATIDDKISIKKTKQIPQNKIVIGVIGNLIPSKGQDILLSAIGNLNEQILQKIHLVIVGRPRSAKNEQWFSELLEKYSNLHPFLTVFEFTEPKPFYDVIDIFVAPSRSETFSLVTIEAMLSGCCVIRSETGGSHDQIRIGETGFLFPVEEDNKLTEILESIILNDNLRKEVAKKGRQDALKRFTSDIMINETLKVYEKVLLSQKTNK